jgi:hypothetical protein
VVKEVTVVAVVVAAAVVATKFHAKFVAKLATPRCTVTSGLMLATMGEEKHVNVATTGYNIDTEWYTDTGATDHVTSELDKLAIWEKYHGSDLVHTASDSGMPISHVGHTTIRTPNRDLVLKNILHVPSSFKNLLSVHKFT